MLHEGKKACFPQYGRCTANLACSILKGFGLPAPHEGIREADELLGTQKENVVIFLLDGMGQTILDENATPKGFFQSAQIGQLSSVFPATTVASTTSVQSGLYPVEHSWLGWNCYFPREGMNVAVFPNTFSHLWESAGEESLIERYCPYTSLQDQIQGVGYRSAFVAEFLPPYPRGVSGVCELVEQLCREPGRKYIYAYLEEPDHLMHQKGVHAPECVQILRGVEKRIEKCVLTLSNALVFVTADHGHIDVEGTNLMEYPALLDCLLRQEGAYRSHMILKDSDGYPLRDPSFEPRAVNFFIREGKEERFRELFLESFGEDFLLFSREEVLERQLFGPGDPHPEFAGMLGDYVAAGFGKRAIFVNQEEQNHYKGHHTGCTLEEMVVPLLAYER